MEFNVEQINGISLVQFTVDVLDASNAKEFKKSISPFLAENKRMIFDMEPLKFMDSSGCGALLSCLRQLNSEGGDLKVFGLQKPVRVLFELVRMHKIIEIFLTKEQAISSF